jgi:DMSO/TMAO reductase YedYZ heme-binding membrane subunit
VTNDNLFTMAVFARDHLVPTSQNITYNPEYTRGLLGVNVTLDHLLTQILCLSIGFVCVIVLLGRLAQMGHSYLRRITSIVASSRQQRFWGVEESVLWADIKKYLLYAPLGKKRHNRELKLSEAVNVGVVPSRFHTILISLYAMSQVAYCSILDYHANEKAALVAELRGRSGTLALLNMIPLIILAGRNNPLIPLLRVSFDTYNLMHRWIGRIVVLESLTHVIAWTVNSVDADDWAMAAKRVRYEPFFLWGFIGWVAMTFLLLQSPSPLRHAFYETFLHLHQLGAFFAILGVYIHLDVDRLPQLPWLQLVISLWAMERGVRFARILYLNTSRRRGMTKVVVKALPGEASRVTFFIPRHVHVRPGSHVYAYLPRMSLWMSHPFSIAWAEQGNYSAPEYAENGKLPTVRANVPISQLEKGKFGALDEEHAARREATCVSVIMVARTGMTRKLYDAANSAPNKTLQITGFIEGPYSSHTSSFGSYGTVILFSGGAGITHHMMHVRNLLESAAAGTVATRRVYLIWSVRTTEHLTWVRGFMDAILQMPNRREVLLTKLFVSKPRSVREISSPSDTLQMFPGRCRPDVVLDEVLPDSTGATAVSVCGPGAFADEVRASVRRRIGRGVVIDFVEEAFTW